MPQTIVDSQVLAQVDLHNYLEAQVQEVAPTCAACKYFAQSNNFPLFGYCRSHGENVKGCDRSCSFAASLN